MYSRLDVLARKGIIPAKRASRLKSRLAAQAVK
jgi:ribosomal protein S20